MFYKCSLRLFLAVLFSALISSSGEASAFHSIDDIKASTTKNAKLDQKSLKEFDLEDFEFWSDQCLLASQEENYEETQATCEEAISLEPKKDNANLWLARSNALFNLGNYVEAIASYNRVLRVAPKSSISMAYKCAALFQLNRYDDAIDTCEEALQVDGIWGDESPAIAWYYRGLALQATYRLETALESLIRAVSTDPNNEVAQAGLCALESDLHPFFIEFPRYDIARRLNTIKQTFGTDLNNSIGIFDLFRNDLAGNEYNYVLCSLHTAVKLYEKALASEPNQATLWMEQGLVFEQLGELEKALTSYNQAVEILPDYAIALAHKCAILVQLENYEAALESCEIALKSNNNWGRQGENIGSAYGWAQKSAALIGLGQYEDALAATERAIAIAPDYSVAWNNKAVSQWHLNKVNTEFQYKKDFDPNISIKKAISLYEDSLAKYQDSPNIQGEAFELKYHEKPIFFHRSQIIALFNQGKILASNGDFETATTFYQRALDLNTQQEKSWGFSLISDQLTVDIHINKSTAHISKNSGNSCIGSTSDLNDAITHAQAATNLDPSLFTAWYTLGLAELYSCNFGPAETHFTEALRRSPEDIHTLTGLGIAQYRNGEQAKAMETFEQILNIDSSSTLASACREYLIFSKSPLVEGTSARAMEIQSKLNANKCRTWL